MHDYKEAMMNTITVSAYSLAFHTRENEIISEINIVFKREFIQNANDLKKQRRLLC